MSGAEAGMSVLAQAAGLLDIEDAVEEDANLSGSYSDNSSNGVHYADEAGSSAGPGSRSTTSSGSRGGGGGGGGGVGGGSSRSGCGSGSSSSSSGGSGGRFRSSHCHNDSAVDYHHHRHHPTASHQPHQTHHHGGGGIDHGSTPPGSASPLPSGAASGGGVTAGDAPPCNGEGSGGGDSGDGSSITESTARAFAVGAGDTVPTSGAVGRSRPGFYGTDFGRDGGGGGMSSYGGEGAGGGCRVTPQWASASGSSRPASPPTSRWFVGPGGVHRRSLGSVPGPWRPYWRGESSAEAGDGMGAEEGEDRRGEEGQKEEEVEEKDFAFGTLYRTLFSPVARVSPGNKGCPHPALFFAEHARIAQQKVWR